MPTAVELVTGLAGAVGSDFRSSQNQLLFVEYGGKLSALNLFPASSVVSQNNVTLKGTFTFDLDTGVEGGVSPAADIWWDQKTTVLREMAPFSTAKIINLGFVDFNSITAANLQSQAYATTPIPGNNDASNKLVNGDVFAVKTTSGNFAKVKVVTYGYDMVIQYVTYHVDSPYVVLGTGYTNPEDVKASKDNLHAYVTERSGDLVKVSLSAANRASATVVTSGLNSPQQFALDELHNAAYVVEYAAAGHLFRVDLTTGAKAAVVSNLNFAVGITLSADLQYAYISEQTTGPDGGRVSRYRLSDGSRTPMKTGMTAPFFLSWADAAKTSLFVPERDPANRITSINVTNFASQVVAASVPVRPSSVALSSPGTMLICSNAEIEQLTFLPFQPAGPLLMGIGFIPFDKITASGLADTTGDPTYFYQVKNTPFGGALPLMVNHQRAANDGASYYRIKVDGAIRTDSWTDEKWNGTQYVATTTATTVVAGQPGYYPVHPVSELFLWLNPTLGSLLDSTSLPNGNRSITIEFVNGLGVLIEPGTPLTIRVDNNHCAGTVSTPTLNGNSADPNCGLLHYTGLTAFPVTMPLVATHPNSFATYSFQMLKGVNTLTPPSTSGAVPAPAAITASVSTLLGGCGSPGGPGIAAFSEYLYVYATANNGWSRQSQYDASAALAFVLVP